MRSKFLLDENETQRSIGGNASHDQKDTRLEKANAVIDIMSSALSLMAQINETDRINILKVLILGILSFSLFFCLVKCPIEGHFVYILLEFYKF